MSQRGMYKLKNFDKVIAADGRSKSAIAKAAKGLNRKTLDSMIKNGRGRKTSVERVAKALGKPLTELLDDESASAVKTIEIDLRQEDIFGGSLGPLMFGAGLVGKTTCFVEETARELPPSKMDELLQLVESTMPPIGNRTRVDGSKLLAHSPLFRLHDSRPDGDDFVEAMRLITAAFSEEKRGRFLSHDMADLLSQLEREQRLQKAITALGKSGARILACCLTIQFVVPDMFDPDEPDDPPEPWHAYAFVPFFAVTSSEISEARVLYTSLRDKTEEELDDPNYLGEQLDHYFALTFGLADRHQKQEEDT